MKKLITAVSAIVALAAFTACNSTPSGGSKGGGAAKAVDFDLKAVAQYSFDEAGDGEIPDLSGNDNGGIVDSTINLVDGKFGKALSFDGAETYILMPDAILDTPDAWSFCVWVKPNSWADWARVFDFGAAAASDMWLGYAGIEHQLRLDLFAGENVLQPLLGKTPVAGQWTHVAITIGEGTASMYLNGELAASGPIAILPKDLMKKGSYVGRSNWPDPLYNGLMDDLLVSGACFTQDQVKSIMTGLPVAK